MATEERERGQGRSANESTGGANEGNEGFNPTTVVSEGVTPSTDPLGTAGTPRDHLLTSLVVI